MSKDIMTKPSIQADGTFNEKKFRVACIEKGISLKEIAKQLGMNYSSLYRKLQSGGNFTRNQIQTLYTIFGVETANAFLFNFQLA